MGAITESYKEKSVFEELNPRNTDPVPPFMIQRGKSPAGIRVGYDELFSSVIGPMAQIERIALSSLDGTTLSVGTSSGDILLGQVFGG